MRGAGAGGGTFQQAAIGPRGARRIASELTPSRRPAFATGPRARVMGAGRSRCAEVVCTRSPVSGSNSLNGARFVAEERRAVGVLTAYAGKNLQRLAAHAEQDAAQRRVVAQCTGSRRSLPQQAVAVDRLPAARTMAVSSEGPGEPRPTGSLRKMRR